ncbi:MAG: RecX family transcriptional regulator [Flavobacteriales bacterium]|nr:RecX family transcriptional regulator [Flavobacteriales bacterium]
MLKFNHLTYSYKQNYQYIKSCIFESKLVLLDFKQKLEHYCAYQDRSHQEVIQKMFDLKVPYEDKDEIIVHLIEHNFLNEERFAKSFARGKHNIKKWGRIRIVRELEMRQISSYNIKTALKEIDNTDYLNIFGEVSEKKWNTTLETNLFKKKKKVGDYLFRLGYEKELIYDFINSINE